MPKPKSFLKEAKEKKHKAKNQEPQTADEYLAAGVELEEAGEKWRAGDAVKSMRFFMRAIENYDTGLRKHPGSFDLAYNKARVQYEITQHPKLASQLPAPQQKILWIALESHREALKLNQDNADALFNTAQVLTSLAETLTEGKRHAEEHTQQAFKLLQEALELFQRCLVLQEFRFDESQEHIKMMESGEFEQKDNDDMDTNEETGTNESGEPAEHEQWAEVIEPVTKNTLVDTAVAQLEALATLCGLLTLDPGSGLAWVEEYSYELLQFKIAGYVAGTDREQEVAVARAHFIAALTEVSYRSGRLDVETYKNELSNAWGSLDISDDAQSLCGKADSLVAFNTAVADLEIPRNAEALNHVSSLRWQALSVALESLTMASKIPDADNLPKIHIARGDVEMYRWRLGKEPLEYAPASNNAATLLKNAQTYYRGAAALARRDGSSEEEKDGAVREALATALAGDRSKLEGLLVSARPQVMPVAEEMAEDGLVAPPDMEALFPLEIVE